MRERRDNGAAGRTGAGRRGRRERAREDAETGPVDCESVGIMALHAGRGRRRIGAAGRRDRGLDERETREGKSMSKDVKTVGEIMTGLKHCARVAPECEGCPYERQKHLYQLGTGCMCTSRMADDVLSVMSEMSDEIRGMARTLLDLCKARLVKAEHEDFRSLPNYVSDEDCAPVWQEPRKAQQRAGWTVVTWGRMLALMEPGPRQMRFWTRKPTKGQTEAAPWQI